MTKSSKAKADRLYFNRDISWLEFNYRVMKQMVSKHIPLLEKLRFIDIFRSNTDEFFMKRVGYIYRNKMKFSELQIETEFEESLYDEIKRTVEVHWQELQQNYEKELIPSLNKLGIKLLEWNDLNESEIEGVSQYFKKFIFPILTPLAVDPGRPFPFMSNLSKSIAVRLSKPGSEKNFFARVKIPTEISQWVFLPKNKAGEFRLIHLAEVIRSNLHTLFNGMDVDDSVIFRITRDAAVNVDEGDEIEDVMEWLEEELKEKRFAPVVRLEVEKKADNWLTEYLMDELDLKMEQVFEMESLVNFTNFSKIIDLPFPKNKFKPLRQADPSLSITTSGESIFSLISRADHLVHFPYESFSSSVEFFLKSAVEDPKVRAIKLVLYRTDADGRLINLLIEAAERKKQVACIIELKARFDEESNIKWAQKLEEFGVHVAYGMLKFKTHAKLALVVREEKEGLKTYVNIGTGNFNVQTSKLYTDLSYFTCNPKISNEVLEVFNHLTGLSVEGNYKNLLVAPFNLASTFEKHIEKEIKNKQSGKPARIIAKMNSLQDPRIVKALYHASKEGVPITLFVRGFCCLRPGVKGLSENIKVISIIGRFLEHSRIFHFAGGKEDMNEGHFFIGSADWMYRNLYERVEVATPITDKSLKKELATILDSCELDNCNAWELLESGKYKQIEPKKSEKKFDSHQFYLKKYKPEK